MTHRLERLMREEKSINNDTQVLRPIAEAAFALWSLYFKRPIVAVDERTTFIKGPSELGISEMAPPCMTVPRFKIQLRLEVLPICCVRACIAMILYFPPTVRRADYLSACIFQLCEEVCLVYRTEEIWCKVRHKARMTCGEIWTSSYGTDGPEER